MLAALAITDLWLDPWCAGEVAFLKARQVNYGSLLSGLELPVTHCEERSVALRPVCLFTSPPSALVAPLSRRRAQIFLPLLECHTRHSPLRVAVGCPLLPCIFQPAHFYLTTREIKSCTCIRQSLFPCELPLIKAFHLYYKGLFHYELPQNKGSMIGGIPFRAGMVDFVWPLSRIGKQGS